MSILGELDRRKCNEAGDEHSEQQADDQLSPHEGEMPLHWHQNPVGRGFLRYLKRNFRLPGHSRAGVQRDLPWASP